MTDKAPVALRAEELEGQRGCDYPAPFDGPCRTRMRQVLGDPFGLRDFGVNLLTLPPGAWSSQRHWHSDEDEFVYVLEGQPTLITDAGETLLTAGMCAGFPAGRADGHHLINRSDRPAVVLEVGSRKRADDCAYSDIDMQISTRDGKGAYTRKSGEPY